MNNVSPNKIFSASFFSNTDGVLEHDTLRLVRNYAAYYQEIFSLFTEFSSKENNRELFKAGHHATWQTISSLNNFYFALLEEKNFEKRNHALCQMLSAQGWGKIQFIGEHGDSTVYYKIEDALSNKSNTTKAGEAFYAGMVLAIYLLSRLKNRQEITQEFLERELENSFSLVSSVQGDENVADDSYSFKVTP